MNKNKNKYWHSVIGWTLLVTIFWWAFLYSNDLQSDLASNNFKNYPREIVSGGYVYNFAQDKNNAIYYYVVDKNDFHNGFELESVETLFYKKIYNKNLTADILIFDYIPSSDKLSNDYILSLKPLLWMRSFTNSTYKACLLENNGFNFYYNNYDSHLHWIKGDSLECTIFQYIRQILFYN